jgi:hypothetical protein
MSQDSAGRLKEIYFESRLALVDDDVNGEGVMDVYRWSRKDGRLSLVSLGNADWLGVLLWELARR